MPMQWNEQADAKLFASVLKLHVVKLDYQALAKAMGQSVTAKAISHRISKIKEKARVRQFDWELYSNPSTSCIPKKRGPKPKIIEDDDDMTKKRVKAENPTIKIEDIEGPCVNADHTLGGPDGIGQYCWANGWPSIAEPGQLFYGFYGLDGSNINMNTCVQCVGNGGGGHESAGPAPAADVGCVCVGNDDGSRESVGLASTGIGSGNGYCGTAEIDCVTKAVLHENLVA